MDICRRAIDCIADMTGRHVFANASGIRHGRVVCGQVFFCGRASGDVCFSGGGEILFGVRLGIMPVILARVKESSVSMPCLFDLKSDSVRAVLGCLLKDRTTGGNIIFATDAYDGFGFSTQMTKDMLLDGGVDIMPRVEKSLEEQAMRQRRKAEVFTPSWICNAMNNHCDEEWFGRANVFNVEHGSEEDGHYWTPTRKRIPFPKGKSWMDYVLSTRLEITCGEAPYLVSRYDTVTGKAIPIRSRIGMLDRKLRVIDENARTWRTWNQWAYKAFESVYGYEYQGDNLLLARINLLETFREYTRRRWHDEPSASSLKRIADIISWNIWQMDGLHYVIPYQRDDGSDGSERIDDEYLELASRDTLFDLLDIEDESAGDMPKACRIYDWDEDRSITFRSLLEA